MRGVFFERQLLHLILFCVDPYSPSQCGFWFRPPGLGKLGTCNRTYGRAIATDLDSAVCPETCSCFYLLFRFLIRN